MKTKLINTLLVSITIGALFTTHSQAQDDERRIRVAKARFAKEPSAQDVVDQALLYFRVDPKRIENLQDRARARGWAPLVAAGYRYDNDTRGADTARTLSQVFNERFDQNTQIHSATIGAIWDLRDAVFHPSEIAAYGIISTQREIMLEAIRYYYLRQQLILRVAIKPPSNAFSRVSLELRVNEFTAMLDSMTGGWFSKETRVRTQGRKRTRSEDD